MRRTTSCVKVRTLLTAVVLGMSLTSGAQASTILFNPTGGGASGALSVSSFNWSAGTAVSESSIPLTVGQTFTTLFETALSGLNGPNGTGIATPGLNSTYQITEIATLSEKVATLTGSTATFALAGGVTSVQIYETPISGTPTYNFVTGAGFVGTNLIYSATIANDSTSFTDNTATLGTTALNKFGTGAYLSNTTDQGQGNTTIGLTTAAPPNPNYFVTPGISSSLFSAGTNTPFTQQAPASMFWNGYVPTIGGNNTGNGTANNGTAPGDFLFQVSAGTESFAVPEPASLVMAFTAVGIVPLVNWQVRRRRARA